MKIFRTSIWMLLLFSGVALACSEPDVPTFRQSFSRANNVVVFRLVSLGLTDTKEDSRRLGGKVEPIRALKGTNDFRYLVHDAVDCGGLNLKVGHYYLVATNQSGRVLNLVRGDKSILDVSDDFGRTYFPRPSARYLWHFEQALKGRPLRDDLIRELSWRIYAFPPMPSEG